MDYDTWKLQSDPQYDAQPLICEVCGKHECEEEARICEDCADIEWEKQDAVELSLAEIIKLEKQL